MIRSRVRSALDSVPTGPIERLARRAARTGGQLTHGARMLPSFLIVGAQRCGTTSLYRTLARHPAVLPAVLHKGAHYFDTGYANGPEWYRGHFPLLLSARLAAARTGTAPITGESSPYYMFHPLAAQRIARDLPDIKIIALLRDPVERAYSAYAHELARGFETEPFERALDLEPLRLAGVEERLVAEPASDSRAHQHHAYLARGRYAPQLARLERQVGRQRLHVVDSERLFAEPERVYSGVLDFLGLPPDPQGPRLEHRNGRRRPALPRRLRARLEEHFRPYDEELVRWLGAPPSWRDRPARHNRTGGR